MLQCVVKCWNEHGNIWYAALKKSLNNTTSIDTGFTIQNSIQLRI